MLRHCGRRATQGGGGTLSHARQNRRATRATSRPAQVPHAACRARASRAGRCEARSVVHAERASRPLSLSRLGFAWQSKRSTGWTARARAVWQPVAAQHFTVRPWHITRRASCFVLTEAHSSFCAVSHHARAPPPQHKYPRKPKGATTRLASSCDIYAVFDALRVLYPVASITPRRSSPSTSPRTRCWWRRRQPWRRRPGTRRR